MELKNQNNLEENAEIAINPYNTSERRCSMRKGLLFKSSWDDRFYDFIIENDIKALYLNGAKGWRTEDYSFLLNLDTIEEVSLLSYVVPKNLQTIEKMKNLKQLALTGILGSPTIDFTKIKKLEKCTLSWDNNYKSIFQCTNLNNLWINFEVKLKDFSGLGNLANLTSLTLQNCSVKDISWLKNIKNLEELELINCRQIEDFSPISSCKNLKWLMIDGSKKLNNLGFVSELKDLRYLNFSYSGLVEGVEPLRNLKELRAVAFNGDTKLVNGDLSPFEYLPNLSMLGFNSAKHYTHKLIKKWNWKNYDTPDVLLEKKKAKDKIL